MSTESELESWREEKQSAYLYRVLADCEPAAELKRLFIKLADAAEGQSLHWEKIAAARGVTLPAGFEPPARARLVAYMLRQLGPERMLPVLAAMKVRGLSVYTHGAPVGTSFCRRHIRRVGSPNRPSIDHCELAVRSNE